MAETEPSSVRRRIFDLLDESDPSPAGKLVDWGLIAIVLVNVAATIVDSVPELSARYEPLLHVVEIVSVAIFTVEYLMRIWTAPEDAAHSADRPWRARFAFALRPASIVDLLSIAPVYAALVTETDLRSLLVLRLFRFFKLARYSPGLASLVEAISAERRALTACGIILLGTVLVTASIMRLVEQDAQPDKFGTLPDAMYWAFITLATVGYGDVVPITPLGKLVAALTAVVGIVMLALPVGILASAFADEIRRRDFVVTMTMVAKVPLFGDLDPVDIAGIMRHLNARSFAQGEAVVRRGEAAHSMFFITSGGVEVELTAGPVRLGPGDFFGEMGLLSGRERSATVVAVAPTRLLVLEATDLKYLMDHTPGMGERIREVAERRAQERAAS